jgi:hypothetical protein
MGFVGNYALGGLSPQIYDMPVILKNVANPDGVSDYKLMSKVGLQYIAESRLYDNQFRLWKAGNLECSRPRSSGMT